MNSVWIGQKYMPNDAKPVIPKEFYGAKHVTTERHHPADKDPFACVSVGHGSWTEKIVHFLPDKAPSSGGDEIQVEMFEPYNSLPAAINKLYGLRAHFLHLV